MTLDQYKQKLKTITEAKQNMPAIDFQVFVIQVSNDMKSICEAQLKLIEAMTRWCDDNGYDDPSLIHDKCGHYIPRALADLVRGEG